MLDEPANGLDPQGIRWLRDVLRARAAEGRTVLISSHVLAEVAQTVDEVVVISRGRLAAQGSLAELTGKAAAAAWVRSPRAEELRAALAAKDIRAEHSGPDPSWLSVPGAWLEAVGETEAGDMSRTLAAELLKLRTARTYWALAGATLGLVLLITVLTLALTDEFRTEDDVRSVLSTAGASGLLLLVLGVVAGAGEYRHGTIASTLLFTPTGSG